MCKQFTPKTLVCAALVKPLVKHFVSDEGRRSLKWFGPQLPSDHVLLALPVTTNKRQSMLCSLLLSHYLGALPIYRLI